MEEPRKERTPRLDQAGLLRRTFALDVLACLRCGGRRRVLAYVKGAGGVRHTYGSHLAMRGVPLKVIQELMSHATIEMFMRYAHLAPEARESAVQQLDIPVRQL